MIFVGDLAIPHPKAIQCLNFPSELFQKNWFGNLEGAIVGDDDNSKHAVYNNRIAIADLIKQFNFKGFALANNHIFDTGTTAETNMFLDEQQVKYAGIGEDLTAASREIVLHDEGVQIVIVNFGWEVIQCEITTGTREGVNPLRKKHVLDTVGKLIMKYPNAKVIPFMHWSYELEGEPQPFERELAKKLIDLGVAGVIGCHSHRVGGFEIYKGKPIVYSLGNWLFKQNHYFNKKHRFPSFCNLQMAFEWNMNDDSFNFHFFQYNPVSHDLVYVKSEGVESQEMLKRTPFINMSEKEYKKWYRQNHFHKGKGLPIYYINDTCFAVSFKNVWNKLRDMLIGIIVKLKS